MFHSLIKKDKHLLFIIVSGNIFNFLLPAHSRGTLTTHTPAPSKDLTLGEEHHIQLL